MPNKSIDLTNNQDILSFLIREEDFLENLKDWFSPDQISEFLKYAKNIDKITCPEFLNDIFDWLKIEIYNADTILLIGWDSSEWGPGGNGFFRYNCKYGLVMMSSSDYSDNHVEIFDRDRFRPWGIEHLENEYIDLESSVYSEKELKEISESLGLGEHSKLTINGREI
jgi:hypothetical protein